MDFLVSLSYSWEKYISYKNDFFSGKQRNRKSFVTEYIDKIDQVIEELLNDFVEIISFKTGPAMNTVTLSMTYLKKSEAIKSALINGSKLKMLLDEKEFFINVQKRIKERQQYLDNTMLRNVKDMNQFYCMNDRKITWDNVISNLIDLENSKIETFPLNTTKLLEIADIISSNIVSTFSELDI